jgi:hypothetical protein
MAFERKHLGLALQLSFFSKTHVTPNTEIRASKGHSAIRAVIGGNDVRMGWFEQLIENAATGSLLA